MADAGKTAARAGARVQASPIYRAAVTGGLWAYGLVHLLLAWLAFQLVQTPGGSASNEASLTAEAVLGYPWLSGAKRVVRRVASGFRALVYLSLAIGAGQLVSGSAPAGGTATAQKTAASVLSLPFGRVLVGVVAAGIAVGAIDQVQRGVRRTFVKYDMEASPPRWAVRLGTIGWIAKGAVLLVVSGLFWFTALSNDAAKSGSMDLALRTLRAQPFGGWLLALVSAGFACFGVFCFVWSRHARQDVSSRS